MGWTRLYSGLARLIRQSERAGGSATGRLWGSAAGGQIAEVIRDGETGLLYPAGDAEALVAACDRLLSDPMLRRRLGDAAAKEIHGRYTWDQNAELVIDLARSLARARRANA